MGAEAAIENYIFANGSVTEDESVIQAYIGQSVGSGDFYAARNCDVYPEGPYRPLHIDPACNLSIGQETLSWFIPPDYTCDEYGDPQRRPESAGTATGTSPLQIAAEVAVIGLATAYYPDPDFSEGDDDDEGEINTICYEIDSWVADGVLWIRESCIDYDTGYTFERVRQVSFPGLPPLPDD